METQLPLPGLGVPEPASSQLVDQVQRSLRALHDAGMVDERHAGLMQLALELARSIRPGEKPYGVAQAAAQLLAVFTQLMPEPDGGDGDAFAEFRAYLAGVEAAGGSS
jgi:hypothetical protein